ncbi:MAG: two-component system, cell cycle response regulator DivK [Methanolobus sp.]|jgi:two-component system cell cycle response regulator DivK|nr:two-component system, cell cycle response regulator DivK [Methanolobus sp.]MDK2833082.1 two-component system, cell cycle response regulator DivK [Methanolobus sp.]MDK2912184.1 two-component system, cell cycle response regulator DivK [Methanolobus sp.]
MTRILVVEDNPMNMELVTFILTAGGFEVTQAFDGPEALDKIRDSCFDIILLDIQLPGMDGIEVIRHIDSNILFKTPIIALTAHAMQGDEQRFINAGCSGYISKPIDVTTFTGRVLSYVTDGGK